MINAPCAHVQMGLSNESIYMCVCTHVSVAQILASLIYLLNNDEFSTGKSASFLKFAAFGQTPELCRRRYTQLILSNS